LGAADPKQVLAARLRRFLEFVRPLLLSDTAVDRARLKRLRNMTDLRLQDLAVGRPALSLTDLSGVMAYTEGGPSFAAVARERGMLSPQQVELALAHDGPEIGLAISAVLLQNGFDAARLGELMGRFVAQEAAAPRPRPAPEAPAPVRLPPKVRSLMGAAAELWSIPGPILAIRTMLVDPEASDAEVSAAVEAQGGLAARLDELARRLGEDASEPGRERFGRRLTVAAMLEVLDRPGRLDRAAFWAHSLWVAHAAALVCRQREAGDTEEFFLAGLLHDIGKLALDRALGSPMDQLLEQVRGGARFEQAEARLLGVSHAAVGALVGEHWKLPAPLVEAARHHLEEPSLIESLSVPPAAKIVGMLCGMEASRASVESVGRFFRMGRAALEELGAAARERARAGV
jgi:putative nucleotidyltransferase with HDIG domain